MDWITIADDDDIQLAIEFAQTHFGSSLRLVVKPVEGQKGSDKKSQE